MKANFNKKYELHDAENDNDNPNHDKTGDAFYDFIGKFCINSNTNNNSNDI